MDLKAHNDVPQLPALHDDLTGCFAAILCYHTPSSLQCITWPVDVRNWLKCLLDNSAESVWIQNFQDEPVRHQLVYPFDVRHGQHRAFDVFLSKYGPTDPEDPERNVG